RARRRARHRPELRPHAPGHGRISRLRPRTAEPPRAAGLLDSVGYGHRTASMLYLGHPAPGLPHGHPCCARPSAASQAETPGRHCAGIAARVAMGVAVFLDQPTRAMSLTSMSCPGNVSPATPTRVLATCGTSFPYASLRTGPATANAASTSST